MFLKSFSDVHETIEDITAEGDKVWHRFRCTGTHTGEFRGLAPTGKKVTWTGVNFWRIVDRSIDRLNKLIRSFSKQKARVRLIFTWKVLFP